MSRATSVSDLLKIHHRYINRVVEEAGSERLKKEFSQIWSSINYGEVYASIGDTLHFNADDTTSQINNWIGNMEVLRNSELDNYKDIEKPDAEDWQEVRNVSSDINHIIDTYGLLIDAVEEIDMDFANTTRAYRSPLRQALNDITILYNKINNIEGDFSDFEDVAVYVHGIESDGWNFLDVATESANEGEIIVHVTRDGGKKYYIVQDVEGEKQAIRKKHSELTEMESFKDAESRLHVVYDTEYQNEHRQETSDDLTRDLTDMGLINDETSLDFVAHSYGGRRALQFAIDYPEHVRSMTTIGTPYETNALGSFANNYSWIAEAIVNPTEYSGEYQDFNSADQREDDGVVHSTVYTDMDSRPMTDVVDEVEAENPEVYEQLMEMDIVTVAGSTQAILPNDTIVSVKSQLGLELGELIDETHTYRVGGFIGHFNEIPSDVMDDVIKETFEKQKE